MLLSLERPLVKYIRAEFLHRVVNNIRNVARDVLLIESTYDVLVFSSVGALSDKNYLALAEGGRSILPVFIPITREPRNL